MEKAVHRPDPRSAVESGADAWVRRGCAAVVAAVAAYASYVHQRDFALQGGADQTSATLWPLSVDGLLLLVTMGLLSPSRHTTRRTRGAMWLAFLLGSAVSLAANIAAAPTLDWQPVLVAGWPPIALLLSVELLAPRPASHQPEGSPPAEARIPGGMLMPEAPSPPGVSKDDRDLASEASSPGPTVENAGKAPEIEIPAAQRTASGTELTGVRSRLSGGGPEGAPPAPRADTPPPSVPGTRARHRRKTPPPIESELMERARVEDASHWRVHRRPISAENLRKRLGIGAKKSRAGRRLARGGC
ncbi:DUF2637 domain-containing protein [Streptomyces specialis]|uniref:DUF2637 domain-containing protein n=1 Tax=Streptomyces specialis TaxID=498367 RepID=UPI001F41C3F8|nr:DUF2637 domain-containing protein [Streptomyces specialis]